MWRGPQGELQYPYFRAVIAVGGADVLCSLRMARCFGAYRPPQFADKLVAPPPPQTPDPDRAVFHFPKMDYGQYGHVYLYLKSLNLSNGNGIFVAPADPRCFFFNHFYFTFLLELELELIQAQMTQKPMLRAEVYARALRASQNRKEDSL